MPRAWIENKKKAGVLVVSGLVVVGALFPAQPAGSQESPRTVVAAIPRHFPPQYRLDDQGRPGGFAIEAMEAVARSAGLRVNYRVEPDWPAALAALRENRADLIPNLGITDTRRRDFDFSPPLETFAVAVFVRRGTDDIRSVDDLAGHRVSVVEENVAVELLKDRPGVALARYRDFEGALFAVLAGKADAFVAPVPLVLKLAQAARVEERIEVVGAPLAEIKRAMAVRKGDAELLARLNRAIEPFLQGPEYRAIYSRWYGAPTPFWTVIRVLWVVGAAAGLALLAVTLGMGWWRYRSMLALNRELQGQLEELRRFQRATVARELRMKELRDENVRLKAELADQGRREAAP
jgi:ABC-type amino acid transport substrate-binding protein